MGKLETHISSERTRKPWSWCRRRDLFRGYRSPPTASSTLQRREGGPSRTIQAKNLPSVCIFARGRFFLVERERSGLEGVQTAFADGPNLRPFVWLLSEK